MKQVDKLLSTSRYGIPITLMSDGGPQFSSAEFHRFAEEWGFDHNTSSPYYPQSNGLAENGVKVMKYLLTKAAEKGEDPYLAMLACRDASLDKSKSPAELLPGRKVRTRLLSANYRLEKFQKRRTRCNDRGKPLPEFQLSSTVWVKSHNTRQGQWPVKARVVRSSGPQLFDVELEDGRVMCRNHQHLLLSRESSMDSGLTPRPPTLMDASHGSRSAFKVTPLECSRLATFYFWLRACHYPVPEVTPPLSVCAEIYN